MDYITVAWIGISLALATAFIVVLSLYIKATSEKIDPSMCLSIKGDFAVIANRSGTVITSCGPAGTDICEFPVTNLNDAVIQCNARADICTNFEYNESQLIMRIVDPNGPTFDSSAFNIFIRQDNSIV
uniref:PAN domain protein n=1 Tax=Pithovirus LCPAC404 TaxID=2506597 RepID=A0A481ZCB1_9VIRU|nr:MAG: PAN domain protein [Pithovirus LCPAC404]